MDPWPHAHRLDSWDCLLVFSELPEKKNCILIDWIFVLLGCFQRHTGCSGLEHIPNPAHQGKESP